MLRFLAGALASATVFTFYWMGQFGGPNLCGEAQGWQVCTQQWLAAIGPTLALVFAGLGAKGLAKQVEFGQHAVKATQREQLRHEFQILTEIRNGLLEDQKRIERQFEEVYTDLNRLSADAAWEELEAFQYELDGFVEWIDDVRRDPYMTAVRQLLRTDRKHLAWRAEMFREAASSFANKKLGRRRMAVLLKVSILITVRDMEQQRKRLETQIDALGPKMANLTSL